MSDEELSEKIVAEIENAGFPHELRVSNLLETKGYLVANSVYYVDEDEEKGREVDIRALFNLEIKEEKESYLVRHCLLIECKSSKKPWVIFTSPATIYDRTYPTIHIKGYSRKANFISGKIITEVGKIHPLASNRYGRTYFEPFRKKEDAEHIFKSITTSVKATIAARNNKFAAGPREICFYYPMVVFNGDLYESYMANDNIRLEKTDSIMVTFFYESARYKNEYFIVPILNLRSLKDYLPRLDNVLGYFRKLLTSHLDWFETEPAIKKELLIIILQRLNEEYPNEINNMKDISSDHDLEIVCKHLFLCRDEGWVRFIDLSSRDGKACSNIKITSSGIEYLKTIE